MYTHVHVLNSVENLFIKYLSARESSANSNLVVPPSLANETSKGKDIDIV